MKIILAEVSHWHSPLYLNALERFPGVEVTAVSDATGTRGPQIAARFGARLYDGWQAMLDQEQADFAFAFAPHDELQALGNGLVDRRIPFVMEKPCGLNAVDVAELRRRAEAAGVFVAVPLIWGLSGLFDQLRQTAADSRARWRSMAFRFNAGPSRRYHDNRCAWVLDPLRSGGGCTINLAVHFIDLIHRLTGDTVSRVSAAMHYDPAQADVEIGSMVTLVMSGGCICTIETGYTYPGNTAEQREFSFSLAADTFYARSTLDGLRIVKSDNEGFDVPMDLNSDVYYDTFATETLMRCQSGQAPDAGLDTMQRIMHVIDAAYRSDRNGGMPVTLSAAKKALPEG